MKQEKTLTIKFRELDSDIKEGFKDRWLSAAISKNYTNSLENYCYDMELIARPIEFERLKNSTYGNPRYAIHFFSMLSTNEQKALDNECRVENGTSLGITEYMYKAALKKAKKFGGGKYHNKSFGGGIVFTSYNTNDLERQIQESKY
tara:strand:+ start:47 stop:487 length:441 start_codon:yes stop_codon:yes gene_type:complete